MPHLSLPKSEQANELRSRETDAWSRVGLVARHGQGGCSGACLAANRGLRHPGDCRMRAPISSAAPNCVARTHRRRSRGPACRRAPNYNAAGELLGKIHIPQTVANLCFGACSETASISAARHRSMPSTHVHRRNEAVLGQGRIEFGRARLSTGFVPAGPGGRGRPLLRALPHRPDSQRHAVVGRLTELVGGSIAQGAITLC